MWLVVLFREPFEMNCSEMPGAAYILYSIKHWPFCPQILNTGNLLGQLASSGTCSFFCIIRPNTDIFESLTSVSRSAPKCLFDQRLNTPYLFTVFGFGPSFCQVVVTTLMFVSFSSYIFRFFLFFFGGGDTESFRYESLCNPTTIDFILYARLYLFTHSFAVREFTGAMKVILIYLLFRRPRVHEGDRWYRRSHVGTDLWMN